MMLLLLTSTALFIRFNQLRVIKTRVQQLLWWPTVAKRRPEFNSVNK